jgi:hypothetical protein
VEERVFYEQADFTIKIHPVAIYFFFSFPLHWGDEVLGYKRDFPRFPAPLSFCFSASVLKDKGSKHTVKVKVTWPVPGGVGIGHIGNQKLVPCGSQAHRGSEQMVSETEEGKPGHVFFLLSAFS